MNQFDKLTHKIIGKVKVLTMGRMTKREKRIARAKERQAQKTVGFKPQGPDVSTGIVNAKQATSATSYKGHQYSEWNHLISDHSHYPTMVCSVGELNLWGSTKSEITLADMRVIDLVVNCSQMPLTIGRHNAQQITGNSAFDRLNKYTKKVNEVMLDWSDGSDMPVTLDFWIDFYSICIEQGYRNILFCCVGGHGRTGTGIACLVLANSPYDFNMSEKIVDLVRARYCENAIETLTQENYLQELETEKKDRPEARAEAVQWNAYSPKLHKTMTSMYHNGNVNSGRLEPKTLTEVIKQAQAGQDRVNAQKDIFNGQGDSSAEQLNHMEESQAANASIVIDLLTAEERAKKIAEDEARDETLKAIEDYESEQKALQVVKGSSDSEYDCFCASGYECLACEFVRLNP